METYNERAKRYGIASSYCYDIFNGNKGCSEELMLKIKKDYPEMEFVLLHPRWILRKPNEKLSFIENNVDKAIKKLDGSWIDCCGELTDKNYKSYEIEDIIDILRGKDEGTK